MSRQFTIDRQPGFIRSDDHYLEMVGSGAHINIGTNKRVTGGRKITKIRKRATIHHRERERPVRVVDDKTKTNPKLMSRGVRYHVNYKGEKYYVKKYDENNFGLGSEE
jgi:Ni/Co efflux regulator RcnB